jgi:transcriptional regulator with XRE-family HTH domain
VDQDAQWRRTSDLEEIRRKNRRLLPSELVAANIRAEMGRSQVTGQELSRRLSESGWPLSETSISRLLRGKRRMDMNDLFAIADALRTSPDYLIRGQHGIVHYVDEAGDLRMMIDYSDDVPEAIRLFPVAGWAEETDGEH